MITANIITLNEEENIKDCIGSVLSVCDEVLVVDSGSVDKTVEIAKSLGVTVIHQPYLGDGMQKNVALKYAKNKWVLSLDADERLSEEAKSEINKINFDSCEFDAFAFKRRNMIGARWIKHCGWYPDYCIRLFNKELCEFKAVAQHSSVSTKNFENIQADIIHYSFLNIGELFNKPGRDFSKRAAKIMYKKNKRANSFSPFLHGLSAFVRKYFFKRGFLGGVDGLTVSISAAVNSYLKYAKLLEFQRDSTVLEKEDFDKIW